MTEKKSNDVSIKTSRRQMIKGAAATAVVSAGLLVACNEGKKSEQPAAMKESPSIGTDHTGALAIWLALTRTGHFDTNLETWNNNIASDKIAGDVAGYMGLTAYQAKVKKYVDHLRADVPPTFTTMKDLFNFVHDDLDRFSAFYGGPGCPRLYTTLKSIAQLYP